MKACLNAITLLIGFVAGCAGYRLDAELTRADTGLLDSPGMHLILCGTGAGRADAERAGPCTAIIAGGQLFIVDIGAGAWKAADLMGLPVANLGGIFLTKLLADDIADLGEAMTRSWLAGRDDRLPVYGPSGTQRVVEGIDAAYQIDLSMRLARHQAANLRPALEGADPHEFSLDGPDDSVLVVERNGLRVTAFSVGYVGTSPAVGYRFDYRGRAIVIAGHSRGHPNVVKFAAGVDVLVHEATHHGMLLYGVEEMERLGLTRSATFTREMIANNADPVDAAAAAKAADVGMLLLTRLSPPPNDFVMRWVFLSDAREVFPRVTLGEDGMRFYFEPRR